MTGALTKTALPLPGAAILAATEARVHGLIPAMLQIDATVGIPRLYRPLPAKSSGGVGRRCGDRRGHRLYRRARHILAEGLGAAVLAALLQEGCATDEEIAVILTGGNPGSAVP